MPKLCGLIMFLCVGLIVNNACWAKEPAFDWYPPEFERLVAADWPEMKSTLDAVHSSKRDTDVPPLLLDKARYTLNRISQIKWEGEMRDQVRDYLLDFAEERMARASFSDTPAPNPVVTARVLSVPAPVVSTPADLAHVALWAAGQVATDILSPLRLVMLWRPVQPAASAAHQKLRWSILWVLDDHFSDPAIPELLQTLGDMRPVAPDEVKRLESIRRKYVLSQFKDQKLAWEYVWSLTQPERPEEVLTLKFRMKSGQWYVIMDEVYPLDPATTLSIADNSTDHHQRYEFLNHSVCIIRNQLFKRAEQDGNVIVDQDLLKEVESKAQAMVAEMDLTPEAQRVDGYQNYLKDSLKSMRTEAAKPPHPQAEKPTVPTVAIAPAALPNTPPPKADPVPPDSASPPATEEHEPTFSRPEDRGEDFSKLDSHDVIHRLAAADGVADQRKAAKVLGDREIAQTLELTDEERRTLRRYIDTQIEWTAAAEGSDRAEANNQLQRLWTLAAPALIESLGHESRMVQEAAIKNLSLMRNEDLVTKLIARIEASDDPRVQHTGIFALGRMLEKRESLIPKRLQINDEASQAITDRLVSPFLDRWEQAHPDAESKEAITGARRALKHPLDTRMRPALAPAQDAPLAAAVVTPDTATQPTPVESPVPTQGEIPKSAISLAANPPPVPEPPAPATAPNTTLWIAGVLAAIGVTASLLYWRRR